MNNTSIYNTVVALVIVVIATQVIQSHPETGALLIFYSLLFAVLALRNHQKWSTSSKTIKRFGYFFLGFIGFILYIAGIRNGVLVMSIFLSLAGLADFVLQDHTSIYDDSDE